MKRVLVCIAALAGCLVVYALTSWMDPYGVSGRAKIARQFLDSQYQHVQGFSCQNVDCSLVGGTCPYTKCEFRVAPQIVDDFIRALELDPIKVSDSGYSGHKTGPFREFCVNSDYFFDPTGDPLSPIKLKEGAILLRPPQSTRNKLAVVITLVVDRRSGLVCMDLERH